MAEFDVDAGIPDHLDGVNVALASPPVTVATSVADAESAIVSIARFNRSLRSNSCNEQSVPRRFP